MLVASIHNKLSSFQSNKKRGILKTRICFCGKKMRLMLLLLHVIFILIQFSGFSLGFQIFGPGLQASEIVLPARYFYINLTSSDPSSGKPDVEIVGKSLSSSSTCRIWTQVLDRKDQIFIVRYKLYENCGSLRINVKLGGKHIDRSPFIIQGPVLKEECNCPESDFSTWLAKLQCPSTYDQIETDLKPFDEVDMNEALDAAVGRFNIPGAYSFCNYVVLNNEVYRKCYGKHVGFNMFMDAILLSLTRKVRLPDMELLVNLGDWPLILPHLEPLIPMFSWCGSEETADIVMPTYDITQASMELMARVSLDMLSVQANSDLPWSKKHDQAFWRGRDSRRERLDLIDIARKHPDLINAKMTNFFFFRNEMEKYGGKSEPVSFFKFFDYKYQINIDGTVAAYRFPYLLAGDSVVFKQDSKFYEHFYHSLKPWVHYIPIKADLSDLVERLQWAKDHDEEARTIGENGRTFAVQNLLPKDIYCYHAVLFKEWVRRVKSKVVVREGMEKVEQPEDKNGCRCPQNVKDEL